MKKLLVALVLLQSFCVLGAEEAAVAKPEATPTPVPEPQGELRRSDYQIDWQYKAGEYLIYDCDREHYACVNDDGDKICRDDRKEAMEKKLPKYPCAPLKKFSDKKACILESYKIVDRSTLRRFCYPK